MALRLTARNSGKKIRHARHSLTPLELTSRGGLRIRRAGGFRRGLPVTEGAGTVGISRPIRITRRRRSLIQTGFASRVGSCELPRDLIKFAITHPGRGLP